MTLGEVPVRARNSLARHGSVGWRHIQPHSHPCEHPDEISGGRSSSKAQGKFLAMYGRTRHRIPVAGGIWRVQREPFVVSDRSSHIRNQEEHHKQRTFEDELRLLLDKSGIQCVGEIWAASVPSSGLSCRLTGSSRHLRAGLVNSVAL